jgi:hypothetical protein
MFRDRPRGKRSLDDFRPLRGIEVTDQPPVRQVHSDEWGEKMGCYSERGDKYNLFKYLSKNYDVRTLAKFI